MIKGLLYRFKEPNSTKRHCSSPANETRKTANNSPSVLAPKGNILPHIQPMFHKDFQTEWRLLAAKRAKKRVRIEGLDAGKKRLPVRNPITMRRRSHKSEDLVPAASR